MGSVTKYFESLRPKYLIRFDDITPEMNWQIWNKIESICDQHKIKPLLAVVPDNQDKKLKYMNAQSDFWNRVQSWQKKGYMIGIHGFQHTYEREDAGLTKLNRRSEFAGHTKEIQKNKLQRSIDIFNTNDISSSLFVAPGHSFDLKTYEALEETGISSLSDGLFIFPTKENRNILSIPQQLWKFKKRYFGIWTICYHLNHWNQTDLDDFENNILKYRKSISSFQEIITFWKEAKDYWTHSLINKLYEKYFHTKRYLILNLLEIRKLILQKS